MSKIIKFKGNPLTLVGRRLSIGDIAPDFRVVASDLKEVHLSSFAEKVKVVTTFPSIDTPVCDLQVKEFNKRAVSFSEKVVVLGISKDLPFAQSRFCHDNSIERISLFSDYKYTSLGLNYGLLIKELNLLARSILILDEVNTLRYMQIAEELSMAPEYEDALSNLGKIVQAPRLADKRGKGAALKCKPCEGGAPALTQEAIGKMMPQVPGWQLSEDAGKAKKIFKEYKFKDFGEAKYFLDLVALIAEEEGHHPSFTLAFNKLKIALTTHAAGGLTENDFVMARIINSIAG